ncbi:acylphosphatase [Oceanispirochaeta sp.]|jgi:acylphosphatase|uniref:acylphosphatase n=1 Tax=Oceanispirochaeta sp. TaxID=2035350 RepID=UPI00262A41D6|nr:acylphosphatase [Oceanispirochaeta sp.]MDA3957628.1 acylphosphatase [Oceanispirochaeta sp.]
MNEAVRVRVTGRVQGVGFRYSTCRQARRLGLAGWVRNEYDKSVLVHMQGTNDRVQDMLTWLKKGSPGARVDEAQILQASLDNSLIDFNISY